MSADRIFKCLDCGNQIVLPFNSVTGACALVCFDCSAKSTADAFRKSTESILEANSLLSVLRRLARDPVRQIVLRWNWKSAVLSAILRSPIFFTSYALQKSGLGIAFGAMAAQFAFRTFSGGFSGSIIQSFSKVEPPWHAVLTIPLILAAFSHMAEYVVQTVFDSYTGVNGKRKAIAFSIFISIVSAVFNLFAMRRGVLLVKDESRHSIWRDLTRMPWVAFEFISFPIVWTRRRSRKSDEFENKGS